MRFRTIFTGVLTGVLFVGSVWAGAALTPITGTDDGSAGAVAGRSRLGSAAPTTTELGSCADLAEGEACVGASKISLEPAPPEGEVWVHGEENRDACATLSEAALNDPSAQLMHAADWEHTPWIENTGCIYMGGYGIGPMNPVLEWDQRVGMWARSAVISDADNEAIVLTIIDAEGYFGDYDSMCTPEVDGCGAFAIADAMAAELGVTPDSFIIASTHSHTSLDLIGGWGGVPDWYMNQITQAIKDSIRQAWAGRVPSKIYAGETFARGYNNERRDFYRSAEDPSINWIRAEDRNGDVVTALGTYASHPVTVDEGAGIGHGDFPPAFSARVEERFPGSVGMILQAGLGNMSPRSPLAVQGDNDMVRAEKQGIGLANLFPGPGQGTLITNPDVEAKRAFWDQPVTNGPLGSIGGAGFFDRPFGGPASVSVGKGAKPCVSASAVSAHVSVTAAKVGPVVITAAPGEIFANYSNTIEERSTVTALAIGQANDAIGYMPQSFETDNAARQGLGFVGEVVEYEDAYSIDHCFGDMALETTLRLLGQL